MKPLCEYSVSEENLWFSVKNMGHSFHLADIGHYVYNLCLYTASTHCLFVCMYMMCDIHVHSTESLKFFTFKVKVTGFHKHFIQTNHTSLFSIICSILSYLSGFPFPYNSTFTIGFIHPPHL